MADRDASFFGPILPQPVNAREAFSFDELQRIRANRIAADLVLRGQSAWPERRRFRTMYPSARSNDDLTPTDPMPIVRRHFPAR
jgi:hypothetical protein